MGAIYDQTVPNGQGRLLCSVPFPRMGIVFCLFLAFGLGPRG